MQFLLSHCFLCWPGTRGTGAAQIAADTRAAQERTAATAAQRLAASRAADQLSAARAAARAAASRAAETAVVDAGKLQAKWRGRRAALSAQRWSQ